MSQWEEIGETGDEILTLETDATVTNTEALNPIDKNPEWFRKQSEKFTSSPSLPKLLKNHTTSKRLKD